jgi:hypothetical protein
MAKLSVQQIRERARKIVAESPGGIRYGELLKRILAESPETPSNTIQGSIWNLAEMFPAEITKPSRGLFKPTGSTEEVAEPEEARRVPGTRIREVDFYEPFAEWLKNDLDEVTVSASLGGAGLKTKWGTPDVVGIYKPLASNLIKFPLEVVSAEIKIDPGQPVVAFGQATAYRLFSAKSYVVMPRSMSEEDFSRMEALAMLFGIGLVVFDLDPAAPNFEIRVRAQRFLPDMFYVNEFADRLRQHNATMFEELFR